MVTSKDLIEFDVSVLGTQKLPWVRREPKYWRAMKRIKAKTRGRRNNLITLIVTYFYSVHEINLGLQTFTVKFFFLKLILNIHCNS